MDRRRTRRTSCRQCPATVGHDHFPRIVPAHARTHRSAWLPRHFHRHLRTPKSRIRPHLLQPYFRKHKFRPFMSQPPYNPPYFKPPARRDPGGGVSLFKPPPETLQRLESQRESRSAAHESRKRSGRISSGNKPRRVARASALRRRGEQATQERRRLQVRRQFSARCWPPASRLQPP